MKIQRCCECDDPTGRCEEDSIYLEPDSDQGDAIGPLCEGCHGKHLAALSDEQSKVDDQEPTTGSSHG